MIMVVNISTESLTFRGFPFAGSYTVQYSWFMGEDEMIKSKEGKSCFL